MKSLQFLRKKKLAFEKNLERYATHTSERLESLEAALNTKIVFLKKTKEKNLEIPFPNYYNKTYNEGLENHKAQKINDLEKEIEELKKEIEAEKLQIRTQSEKLGLLFS